MTPGGQHLPASWRVCRGNNPPPLPTSGDGTRLAADLHVCSISRRYDVRLRNIVFMTQPHQPTLVDRITRRAFSALLATPDGLRRRLAGAPHVRDGGALNFDNVLGLKVLSKIGTKELDEQTIPDARASLAAESWTFAGPDADVRSVEDVRIPTSDGHHIEAQLFRPHPCPVTVSGKFAGSPTPAHGPVAAIVYFHGGGWVLGSHHTHTPVARALCAGTEVAVLNVNYRLAPEDVFPTAVDDAVAAFRWLHNSAAELGIDPNRIAVAGDSAGGNLSAVVSQELARRGGPVPAMQALLVPVTDLTLPRSDSYEKFASGYFLTQANMDWYEALYLGGRTTPPSNIDELRANPLASPLQAPDLPELAASGLPPAYVAVAGFDPLRDEGIAYANALRAAGVPTTLRVHTDCVHPFINSLAAPVSRRCLTELVGAIRMGLQI